MTSFQSLIGTWLLLALVLGMPARAGGDDKPLTEKLQELAESSRAKAPPEKRKIMEDAIEGIRRSHIVEHALKAGDLIPEFSLPDVKQGIVHSKDLIRKGPVVIVFYRGGWCPYCNLQLHDLQAHLDEIRGLGGELVAISPQTPDNSLSTAQKASLSFYVLSDSGAKVGKQFGIMYKLPANLVQLYKSFGLDLGKSNGTADWELPLGATYVVKSDGRIAYAFLDADYKKRADTRELLRQLKELKTAPKTTEPQAN